MTVDAFKSFSKKQLILLNWWTDSSPYKNRDAIICDGSVRSGKTVCMFLSFIFWAFYMFSDSSFAVCGKTITSLRRNIITPMLPMLRSLGFTYEELVSKNMIIIKKDGRENRFYIFGGKDEGSAALIQGMTLSGVMLDETALMPRSFCEQAIARCSVDNSRLWFNCNPENPGHWFYVEWIKKARERNILYLHFTMDDNLSLAPEIKARYEGMYTGVFYRRYILGLWVKAEGLVYPMFDRSAHIVPKVPALNPRHHYYVSVDYGTVNPFAAGLYDYSPSEQKAIMVKELYYKGGSNNRVDNEAYYKMLCDLIGDYPIQYIIIDPSASSMIETIQKYGKFMAVKADNDVLNGIQDVTKFLNAGCLYFHKSCKSTFEEFETYSWDEEKAEDAVIKENDHSMDQLRYFCRTALRNELKWIV